MVEYIIKLSFFNNKVIYCGAILPLVSNITPTLYLQFAPRLRFFLETLSLYLIAVPSKISRFIRLFNFRNFSHQRLLYSTKTTLQSWKMISLLQCVCRLFCKRKIVISIFGNRHLKLFLSLAILNEQASAWKK